jgi:hypothetical protein
VAAGSPTPAATPGTDTTSTTAPGEGTEG